MLSVLIGAFNSNYLRFYLNRVYIFFVFLPFTTRVLFFEILLYTLNILNVILLFYILGDARFWSLLCPFPCPLFFIIFYE